MQKFCSSFFLSGFSFSENDDSQDIREKEWAILIPLYHFHPLAAHLITTLLRNEMYPPLKIRVWFNIIFVSLVHFMSDSVTITSYRQALGLVCIDYHPI